MKQLLPLQGIKGFKIFSGISVFTMAHISGEHRQGILGAIFPVFDSIQCIDREAMPQAMRSGRREDHVADNLSESVQTDIFHCPVKVIAKGAVG